MTQQTKSSHIRARMRANFLHDTGSIIIEFRHRIYSFLIISENSINPCLRADVRMPVPMGLVSIN